NRAVTIDTSTELFADLPNEQQLFVSEGDYITAVPDSFNANITDVDGNVIAMSHVDKKIYGIQFYPEVSETTFGQDILKNFLFSISEAVGDWSIDQFIDLEINRIK